MKKYFCIIISVIIPLIIVSCGGTESSNNAAVLTQGAQQAIILSSAPDQSEFNAVTTDSSGNIYAAGYIYGSNIYDFGNSVTVSGTNTHSNLVLVKYNASGIPQWAKSVSSGSSESGFYSICIDRNNDIYVAGYISGPGQVYELGESGNSVKAEAIFGNCPLLVKYNSSGEAGWAMTTFEGTGHSKYQSLAIDAGGKLYAAGYITGTGEFNFGNNVTVNGISSARNGVLVKYNSSGVAQWAKTITGGEDGTEFNGVATDPSGNIYVAGSISGDIYYYFGNSIQTKGGSALGDNLLIVKYNSSGLAQWARSVANAGSSSLGISSFNAVAADGNGVYAAGIIRMGEFSFGSGITVVSNTQYQNRDNCLVVAYNSAGNTQWAKSVSAQNDTDSSILYSISTNGSGIIYACGVISKTSSYDFGNSVLVSGVNIYNNPVMVGYDISGNTLNAESLSSGEYFSGFSSVFANANGNVFAAGFISNTTEYDFGNSVTATGSNSGQNAIIVKYNE